MKGARNMPQVKVRLPIEVMEFIRQQAEQNLRSMTAEIALRLTQSKEQQEKQAMQ